MKGLPEAKETNMKRRTALWALTLSLFTSLPAGAAPYEVDRDHSTVGFRIRHLIGNVSGRFDRFTGTIDFDGKNLATLKTESVIETASINTNVEKRDQHLRSADFFDVENLQKPDFKTIRFVGLKVADVKGMRFDLRGNLTIHGVTKPIVLKTEFLGEAKDPWGNIRAAFSAKGSLNRKDFGLTWNKALETGGFLVGDNVEIELQIEALRK
jgi:polyisoprenoid-binding protein YceI